MTETTIVAHDAAEIQVLADALARIAGIRRQKELPHGEQGPAVPFADTVTVTVAEPPAEAPKRRGRPPKSEAAAPTQPAAEPAPAEPAQPEPAVESPSEAAPPITLESVRAALAAASQAGKTAGVRAALAAVKATRLTEVKPQDYQALLDRVGAL